MATDLLNAVAYPAGPQRQQSQSNNELSTPAGLNNQQSSRIVQQQAGSSFVPSGSSVASFSWNAACPGFYQSNRQFAMAEPTSASAQQGQWTGGRPGMHNLQLYPNQPSESNSNISHVKLVALSQFISIAMH